MGPQQIAAEHLQGFLKPYVKLYSLQWGRSKSLRNIARGYGTLALAEHASMGPQQIAAEHLLVSVLAYR